MTSYLSATRHPWACLVFLLPLMIVYEGGVLYFGGVNAIGMRNGADEWLRWGLERYGLGQMWAAPILVVGILVVRSFWSWGDRPTEPLATCFGMMLESVLFAVGLWTIAKNFTPLMQQWGIPTASIQFQTPAATQLVTYIGAGIYEEVLFRLCLFAGLCFLLRLVLLPSIVAIPLAAIAAALTFSAAHHVGQSGEEIVAVKFLFRFVAGLYFTALYVFRGFGIAVGAHAAYDILVGVSVE